MKVLKQEVTIGTERQTQSAVKGKLGGTPIRLKPDKASKERSQERCKARTKAGGACQAPAVERGLCFFHAHPEKLAELGRQGGKRNRHGEPADRGLPLIPLKSVGDVSGLLEETINRVRKGPFDLRAANAIGFLAGILLKAIDSGRMESRLAHLEAVMTGTTGSETEAFEFKSVNDGATHERSKTSENN
jgi:hypothetical protein